MSEPTFTPGPWFVGPVSEQSEILIQPLKSRMWCVAVAIPTGTPPNDQPEITMSNAHLIAAAPEMYDAATRLILEWHGSRDIVSSIDRMKAALAKARGE
jgi:hypothetical protein